MNKPAARFLSEFQQAVSENGFLKMTLSRPVGQEPGLKNLFFRPVLLLKKGEKIQVNFRFQTRDEVKNWSPNEVFSFLEKSHSQDISKWHRNMNISIRSRLRNSLM